jgi:RNA polymerase sigma factor (sigma-70 family)
VPGASIEFEPHRSHLRGVAFRMLGSLAEADDAVQEAWLRLDRAAPTDVANPRGWLTTVVAHICLDMLRSRAARREEALDQHGERPAAGSAEAELMLADEVGLAILVVLDRLEPAERLAFVLHDLFGMPFDEIAAIVARSPDATRQLASRARRRVQGSPPPVAELASQRHIVETFFAALRRGDVDGLIAILDPDVEFRAGDDTGRVNVIRGATSWAPNAVGYARFANRIAPALIDGAVGLVMAQKGRAARVLTFGFAGGRIVRADVIVDRARLEAMEIAALDLPVTSGPAEPSSPQ